MEPREPGPDPRPTPGDVRPDGSPGWLTRGQDAALAAVARWVADGAPPQSLLVVGPAGVGKTTLALDLAAGLLCEDADPQARPCRRCRACRMLAHGNHPDLHRLAPQGPGRQIRIGSRDDPDPGTVRHLLWELSLTAVEGRHRVAIVQDAHRMNDAAQNAFLKMLEEPPPGACLVLCAEDEEVLLPTVRSRCARLRLGTLGPGAIATLLAERGLADAARAAALGALAGGRPGRAIAYARQPDAVLVHGRIARELLDLVGAAAGTRLDAAAGLVAAADELETMLGGETTATEPDADATDATAAGGPAAARTAAGGASPRGRGRASARAGTGASGPGSEDGAVPADEETAQGGRRAPAARRRALQSLASIWRDLARDLAVAQRGGRAELRHLELLDDLVATAGLLPEGAPEQFLVRVEAVMPVVELNANPELAFDVLLLAWPHARRPRPTAASRPAADGTSAA